MTIAPDDQRELAADERGDIHDDARRERQLGAKAGVEIGERRHDLEHDDRNQYERERDQDGRIHQRRDGLSLQRGDDLRVLDVTPQDRIEIAAALACQQRGRVDARKQIVLGRKGVRQRGARPDAIVDIVEHRTKYRRRDAALQQIQRLHQRHAGLEERGEFLVEDQELAHVDAGSTAAGAVTARLWRPLAAAKGRTDPSPGARGGASLRSRRRRRLRRFRRSARRSGSGIPRSNDCLQGH